ncbi:hypothetical protein B0H10DRAFT_2184040 [Mycena sp. CBHHK59/15]|nr:hypothetical protein B0H10DRAFT_2184040 [Mycena sp. CBHHK59/15]
MRWGRGPTASNVRTEEVRMRWINSSRRLQLGELAPRVSRTTPSGAGIERRERLSLPPIQRQESFGHRCIRDNWAASKGLPERMGWGDESIPRISKESDRLIRFLSTTIISRDGIRGFNMGIVLMHLLEIPFFLGVSANIWVKFRTLPDSLAWLDQINIPPLGSSKIRLHGDKSEFEDGEWADSDDEEESFALMALDVEAAQRVREVNVATAALMEGIPLSWPPPYSPGSSSSLPLYPLSSPVASSSRPSPTKSDGCVKPYFTRTQAEEQANFNRQFTTGLHDKQFSGKFKVVELYPELEGLYDMATRMYPEGTPLPNHSDHINSMVGRAWIAWNSRVGVPQDVWAILSSAWTHCPDCDLVRTFDADQAHKDNNNICRDIGQRSVSTIVKGAGKRMAGEGTMVVWKM